ncbi:hypothetical protein SFC65_20115 [Priestia filamentosa]|uniref:TnsA endonuclease N-terminal domain-containing protein n=1 Tax=Priestia filamentosa TaxID=1402861 RepID=UPI003981E3AD
MGGSLEELTQLLEECILSLNANERDQEVSRYYYGLAEPKYFTIKEIEEKFEISREQIRQLVQRNERRIKSLIRRKQKEKDTNHPAVKFVSLFSDIINDQEEEWIEEMAYVASMGLPHIPLSRSIKSLINMYLPQREAKELIEESIEKVKKAGENSEFIFKSVEWPQNRKRYSKGVIEKLSPQRATIGRRKGTFYSEKNKRNVQYESGIELSVIEEMENSKYIISYCEQAITVKFSFKGMEHQYHPDFIAMTDDGSIFVVEVKPVLLMADYMNLRKWMALGTYCEQRGFGIIITDGKTTFSELTKRSYPREVGNEIHQQLRRGKTMDLGKLKQSFGGRVSAKDLVSIIIRNRFKATTYVTRNYLSITIRGFL